MKRLISAIYAMSGVVIIATYFRPVIPAWVVPIIGASYLVMALDRYLLSKD